MNSRALYRELDPRAARKRRRRRFMRIAMPLLTVLVIVAAVFSISSYLHKTNRDDAGALSSDLLRSLESRIVTEVQNYLLTAVAALNLATDFLEGDGVGGRREAVAEEFGRHVIKQFPQIANFLAADPRGNFLMVKKWSDGRIDTKRIVQGEDSREVTMVKRGPGGTVLRTENLPNDTYDPRTRPWFQGAANNHGLYWSNVYLFFTDKAPGITASRPILDLDDQAIVVYGADIQLTSLSAFLDELEFGKSGLALIFDEFGNLVAHPDADQVYREVDGQLQHMRVNELGDPVLNQAYDRFQIEGHGARDFDFGGRRYMTSTTSLRGVVGRDWTILLVVPEDDLVGFVARNHNTGLLLSSGVLALVSILAGLLVTQGLRADRNAQAILDRQLELEAQSEAFSELAGDAALFDENDTDSMHSVTEVLSRTLNVRRVSVWKLGRNEQGESQLSCEDCFDGVSGGHTEGTLLRATQFPALFKAIEQSETIFAADSALEAKTPALYRDYLAPNGCRAFASVPITTRGSAIGTLWLEDDRVWAESDSDHLGFARAIANMLALRHHGSNLDALSSMGRTGGPGTPEAERPASNGFTTREQKALPEAMRVAGILDDRRSAALTSSLGLSSTASGQLRAHVVEDVSVLTVKLTDPIALVEPVPSEESGVGCETVADYIAQYIERRSSAGGVEYAKILGDQIVFAAGTGEGAASEGARCLADLALDLDRELSRLFTALDRPGAYRLGLDTGPVIGCLIGQRGQLFNLWGDAVSGSERMAHEGVDSSIQVTESAYHRLQHEYLFRVRGSYFLSGIGESTTYLLTGSL